MADAFDIGAGVHSLVSAEYARRLNIPSQNSSDVLHVHCCVSFCSLLGQASLTVGQVRLASRGQCAAAVRTGGERLLGAHRALVSTAEARGPPRVDISF